MKEKTKTNKTQIGGQAVLEGVMMRGKSSMATAVRDSEGIIRLETKRVTPPDKQPKILRVPVIRGVVNFVNSMIGGSKTLMRSAEVYGEEEEPSKFEKWLAEKLHIDAMGLVTTIGLILGMLLAVGLFILLPQFLTGLICMAFTSISKTGFLYNLIEGLIRIGIFIVYILLTTLMKDIRRTFMYHGAEHKTISCYESGLELTVENAKKCTRVHNRCGTTFLFLVMLISILVFSVANSLIGAQGIWRALLKIAFLPLVAGLSYELLKLLAKTESKLLLPLKAPGLLLQRLTTKEPTDDMLEVAITSFKAVLEMDANPEIPEQSFITALKTDKLISEVSETLKAGGVEDQSDVEWIVSIATGLSRSELSGNTSIQAPSKVERAMQMAKLRSSGKPLWQIVGDTDFYGYTIKVNENVLTPRPETEQLCSWALQSITQDDSVLDLCTGSGAIAIVINKKSGARVTAVDVSESALETARENASLNLAEVDFVLSNMFEKVNQKYSVIISNPPYIPTSDIQNLDREVKDYEPHLALDGGDDGLDFYRIIAKQSGNYLYEGGLLYLECGINQAEDIASELAKNGFISIEIQKDLSGISRMIKAVKK